MRLSRKSSVHISASILSKKAIEGISSLLLDVKYGHGLVQDYESGEKLVNIMVSCFINPSVVCKGNII